MTEPYVSSAVGGAKAPRALIGWNSALDGGRSCDLLAGARLSGKLPGVTRPLMVDSDHVQGPAASAP